MIPEDARRRIATIRADKAHPFLEESHPEHSRAVRDMEALYAQAYPEPAVQNPFDRPPPMKAPPPADPALKHRERGRFWEQSAPIPREALDVAQGADDRSRQRWRKADEGVRDWWNNAGRWVDKEIDKQWKSFLTGSPRGTMTQADIEAAALSSANAMVPKAARDREANAIIDALRRQGLLPSDNIRPEDIPVPRWEDRQNPEWISGGFMLGGSGVIWIDRHRPKKFLRDLEGAASRPSAVSGWNSETSDQREHQRDIDRNSGLTGLREPRPVLPRK